MMVQVNNSRQQEVIDIDHDDGEFEEYLQANDFDGKILTRDFKEMTDPPGSPDAVKEGALNENVKRLSKHFHFEDVEEREHANKRFGGTATPKFKEGIASLAQTAELDATELQRRAIFAADVDPSILFSPAVNAREAAFQKSAFKQGGAYLKGKPG